MTETVTKYRCRSCHKTFDREYEARMHADNHQSKPYQKASSARGPSPSELVEEIEVEEKDAGRETDLTEWGAGDD